MACKSVVLANLISFFSNHTLLRVTIAELSSISSFSEHSVDRLAAGTTSSIFIIDILQNKCLLNVAPSDLCNNDVGRLATPGTPKSWLQSGSSTDQEKMGDTENNPKTLEVRCLWGAANFCSVTLDYCTSSSLSSSQLVCRGG